MWQSFNYLCVYQNLVISNMKKFFILILAAAFLSACTSTPRESENVLCYASNTCDWLHELRVTHVEYTDTATVLTFFYKSHQPWGTLSILPKTYLSDEQDRHYQALFMLEHELGEYFPSGPNGSYFHVGFEPLPAGTRIFDMIEGMDGNEFKILGIHDSTYVPAKPKFSRNELKEAEQIRRGIFKSGAVTLRGTIAGYDINSGFQTYQMHYTLYDTDNHESVALDLDPTGHFEYSFDVDNMIGACIVDHNQNWHNFIAQPGDTLDIVFYKDGTVSYMLSDGRPYLLRNYDRIPSGVYTTDRNRFEMGDSIDLPGIQAYAFECKARGKEYIDYIAVKYKLTAFEYQYANIIMENDILEDFLDYRMDIRDGAIMYLNKNENPIWDEYLRLMNEAAKIQRDPEGYRFLADFTANDSLMMVMPHQWPIFNRYKYDNAFRAENVSVDSLEGKMDDVSLYILESELTYSATLANDMNIYGTPEPTLFGKLCLMEDLEDDLDMLNYILKENSAINKDSAYAAYLSMFKSVLNDPNLESRIDKRFVKFKRSLAPYWDIPECRGKEVLKKILANYPGKYVYIDFWSTGCGPCVSGIKSCYTNQRHLMTGKYDNFVMIFITSDPEEAYEPFRKEWLDGAESYRVSQDDYNSLAGLFNFSGIPHHELITPDGRAVTKVPEMYYVDPNNPDPNQ